MRKLFASCLLLALLASCQEWDPVFTGTYRTPDEREPEMAAVNTTIAELKQRYIDNGGKAVEFTDHVVIGGQVISSDRSGNIYRELYIQDETGAISVKVGKSSLYSDYRLGQWVYVDCKGLTLGSYSGMPQLGIEDESGEYDTAYIDAQYLINTHIFRGREAQRPEPRVLTAAELKQALADGRNTDSYKRIFAILYIGDDQSNRVFLSDRTYGVTTWAMSKTKLLDNIAAGKFDGVSTQGGRKVEGELLEALIAGASPVTMSQYFSLADVPVQIRTSGYARFADVEIPAAVIGDPSASAADGAPVEVTGILTIYNGAAQFTLLDVDGVQLVQNE